MSDVIFAGNAPVHICVTSPFFRPRDPFERETRRPHVIPGPGWINKYTAGKRYGISFNTIARKGDTGVIKTKQVDGVTVYWIDDIIKYAESTKETRAAWKKDAKKKKK